MESHKLAFHVSQVNKWLEGGDIYPIYMEIGATSGCNHRCKFCALDYLGYKTTSIDKEILKERLSEAASLGVKSIMYAGEGEPLLYKDIGETILFTKGMGIDVALTTNGVFFNKDIAGETLGALSWVRISLNAGKAETYSKIHCCHVEDFKKVLNNIAGAIRIKNNSRYICTIGVQFLLLPDNYREAKILAEQLRDIGVDYLIIKPYSQHPSSSNRLNGGFDYSDYMYLNDELQMISSDKFKIIFRAHTMQKLKRPRPYLHCLGLPFWAYIASNGNVYACSTFLGDAKFAYGDIYKNSFKEIWEGPRRKEIQEYFATKFDVRYCRENCRLDEINRYLWELRHPHPHINFI